MLKGATTGLPLQKGSEEEHVPQSDLETHLPCPSPLSLGTQDGCKANSMIWAGVERGGKTQLSQQSRKHFYWNRFLSFLCLALGVLIHTLHFLHSYPAQKPHEQLCEVQPINTIPSSEPMRCNARSLCESGHTVLRCTPYQQTVMRVMAITGLGSVPRYRNDCTNTRQHVLHLA